MLSSRSVPKAALSLQPRCRVASDLSIESFKFRRLSKEKKTIRPKKPLYLSSTVVKILQMNNALRIKR